jgi:hypothetical protein
MAAEERVAALVALVGPSRAPVGVGEAPSEALAALGEEAALEAFWGAVEAAGPVAVAAALEQGRMRLATQRGTPVSETRTPVMRMPATRMPATPTTQKRVTRKEGQRTLPTRTEGEGGAGGVPDIEVRGCAKLCQMARQYACGAA